MNIIPLFEELASTAYHKINIDQLLSCTPPIIQQAFANNDASSIKTIFNANKVIADRTTIFEL